MHVVQGSTSSSLNAGTPALHVRSSYSLLPFSFQTKQLAPGGRIVSSTAEAEQALSNLETLRVNKQYTVLAEHILEAHSFIANPLHSLMEGPQFVVKLVRQLFPGDRALAIIA